MINFGQISRHLQLCRFSNFRKSRKILSVGIILLNDDIIYKFLCRTEVRYSYKNVNIKGTKICDVRQIRKIYLFFAKSVFFEIRLVWKFIKYRPKLTKIIVSVTFTVSTTKCPLNWKLNNDYKTYKYRLLSISDIYLMFIALSLRKIKR